MLYTSPCSRANSVLNSKKNRDSKNSLTKQTDFATKLTQYLAYNRPKHSLGDHKALMNQSQFNMIFDELQKRKNEKNGGAEVIKKCESDLFAAVI